MSTEDRTDEALTEDLGTAENADLLDDADELPVDALAEGDDALQEYGSQVTGEDLGTQDRIDDGDDLAMDLVDADERVQRRLDGVVPLDEEMVFDDQTHDESLEERFRQEEPDPNSSIVPEDAGRRS